MSRDAIATSGLLGGPDRLDAPSRDPRSATAQYLGFRLASVLAIGLLGAGCGSYRPGSFVDSGFMWRSVKPFPGERVTVGCVELGVARDGDTVRYSFGNRCERSTEIDLGAIRVVDRDARGTIAELVPYDPKAEIKPLPLDGLMSGWERIAYGPREGLASDRRERSATDGVREVVALPIERCVEVSRIERGRQPTREIWIGCEGKAAPW